jgi:hypothetical protein
MARIVLHHDQTAHKPRLSCATLRGPQMRSGSSEKPSLLSGILIECVRIPFSRLSQTIGIEQSH